MPEVKPLFNCQGCKPHFQRKTDNCKYCMKAFKPTTKETTNAKNRIS